ncbi:hypothetical protein [Myxococcus landrumensis]|uniref:Lipoprotein n=1 Tax=Myxococcus landrumensis TaxID=2813577 RepID=A0ABX7N9U6_9BACT|nr:hypothetical protein [Myxococcus landrumus]QSQ15539.1 hypothetical protein JY572_05560 [Myxococcus landrumus]
MSRVTAVLLVLLLSACDSNQALPAPSIRSISPREVQSGYPGVIRVSLDAMVPIRVDYTRQEAQAGLGVRLWFGTVEAPLLELDADSTLEVFLPESLSPGVHDVRVVLADGREALRAQGFSVLSSIHPAIDAGNPTGPDGGVITPDAGPSPDSGTRTGTPMTEGDITGFEFTPVEEQRRGQPFVVTVRALGPRAAEFEEKVDLSLGAGEGRVTPSTLDQFVGGVCTQSITVDSQSTGVKLLVTDRFGVSGTSNAFGVR